MKKFRVHFTDDKDRLSKDITARNSEEASKIVRSNYAVTGITILVHKVKLVREVANVDS